MSDAAEQRYRARLRRVLDHIEAQPDGDLSLAALSRVAAFSPFHFHRQFAAATGLPLHRYVRLVRLKRAAHRLALRERETVTQIAFDAGFASPDAFARAFRKILGVSPSGFRRTPDLAAIGAAFDPLVLARRQIMPQDFSLGAVRIVELPPAPVAIMTHRGAPADLPATIRRFIAWRRAHGLRPPASATYTIFHDPRTMPAADYRLDLCAGTDRAVPAGTGVEPGLIPGGRRAMLRLIGGSDDLEPAALFLYRDWLPASGEEPGEHPLYCRRVTFFPDVPEAEAVTELYLPLR